MSTSVLILICGVWYAIGLATGWLLSRTDSTDWGEPDLSDGLQDDPAMYQAAMDDLPNFLKRQAE